MREREIFIEALEKGSPPDRAALLDRACHMDGALRGRVEQLLAEHDRQGSFILDKVPADLIGTADHFFSEHAGTVIGPYKLLQQIGEGGMGVVFMATQTEPIQRTVAIKIIKPGMDTRQVIARFEAERQAVAMMDHPNIAKVLDAGTTETGRPYFVMELVKGVPITKYCDEKNLPLRARLELFLQVCEAVQHAHQKGLIHRDIKPNNVLVAEYDDHAVPKVIDFGVAKATASKLTEKTMFTELGQMVGTVEYMSPEQAKLNQLDIDTRSDIYSLGVLLYELLTGSTPFARKRLYEVAFDEMLRIIREEEPPKPSTRLSSMKRMPSSVSNRRLDALRLNRLVRGELDWIVMKALEKDRTRRYESASSLAADVRRYLTDGAVKACPPSAAYRFRKFARRNKTGLFMAAFLGSAILLTLAGLTASTFISKKALKAETLAEAELEDALYLHRIALSQRELSMNNLGGALQLLRDCPEERRQWEWYYLMRLCRVEPTILHEKTEVSTLAFSSDGELLASAGIGGTITIRNSKTNKVIQTLTGHRGWTFSIAFHPDGKHLASTGADQKVKVWDWTTREEVFSKPCDVVHMNGTAYSVAFSPDGQRLAAGNKGAVSVWDWRSDPPVLMHSFPGHGNHAISVAFSPDGRHLASGSWWGSVKLWDTVVGGEALRAFPESGETRHPVSAIAFSPNGRQMATASFERRVDVWDTATGELLHTLVDSGRGLVLCVAFSPDGRLIASSGEDKIVRVWDASNGREVLSLRGHTSHCGSVAFSPDGHRLASAGSDGTIRIWNATPLREHEGQELLNFTGHNKEIWSVAVSPDGKKVASAGWGTSPDVWDLQTGQLTAEFDGHKDVAFCVAWQRDGQAIASAGRDGEEFTVKVWNAKTGTPTFTLPSGPEYFAAAFTIDGSYLVTGRANRMVQVWDARTGAAVG